MLAHALASLTSLWLVLFLIAQIAQIKLLPTAEARNRQTDFVAHEWGTFTSVIGRDGQPLEWSPLSFESDLPAFVYSIDKGASWRGLRYPSKSRSSTTVRMETPVLYFYASDPMTIAARVEFPGGRITEWYPKALSTTGGIDWGQIQILPTAKRVKFPHDGSTNHYYPARETDAASIRVRTDDGIQNERFLFYRGVGDFKLPLTIKLDGDRVIICNPEQEAVGKIFLFENRGGRVGYSISDLSGGGISLDRNLMQGDIYSLRQQIRAELISGGLYDKEADAMLNTWGDSWFEEGLRVFYVMPRKATDAILPITLEPAPAELVRVLVGRTELITPEMEKEMLEQVMKLDSASPEANAAALKQINKYGRFTAPILSQLWRHTTDEASQTKLTNLLNEMSNGRRLARQGEVSVSNR
jgi:hypothetical protein